MASGPASAMMPAQADPLAALRGIHLPEPIGMWPPAPGRWIVLAATVGLVVAAWVVVRARRASLARHALRELDVLDGSTEDLQGLALGVSMLLRRVALRRFSRRRVASLHGDDWQAFLAETGPRGRRRGPSFDHELGRLLASAPYMPPGSSPPGGTDPSRDRVLLAARRWIRWNT